jgi:hypothetical protein
MIDRILDDLGTFSSFSFVFAAMNKAPIAYDLTTIGEIVKLTEYCDDGDLNLDSM